jgi:acyl-coenzyme A synthetase/AMP-(fatty) acid ligase
MALWLPKDGPEALICKFAAARLGMKVVEIDMTESNPEAIKKVLLDSKAKVKSLKESTQ